MGVWGDDVLPPTFIERIEGVERREEWSCTDPVATPTCPCTLAQPHPLLLPHPAVEGTLSAELHKSCEAHLSAKHGVAERLARCWGGGAGFALDETKDSIRSMLKVGFCIFLWVTVAFLW